MAQKVMKAMAKWKGLRPKKGLHPLGPPRMSVAMAIATYMTEDSINDHGKELKVFKEHVKLEVKTRSGSATCRSRWEAEG